MNLLFAMLSIHFAQASQEPSPPVPIYTLVDSNVGGPVYPTARGLNLFATRPMAATVLVAASTGIELHAVPSRLRTGTLVNSLDTYTNGESRLLAQSDGYGVEIRFPLAVPFSPILGFPSRFARLSNDGQLQRNFTYPFAFAATASSSSGEFQISGRTLRALPENGMPIDLSWCEGTSCRLGSSTLQAQQEGAWFIRTLDCTLLRVNRAGTLLETLPLPIPAAACTNPQLRRDLAQGLRITQNSGLVQYALNVSDEGFAQLNSGFSLSTENNVSFHPIAGGDWLVADTFGTTNTTLSRYRPNPFFLVVGFSVPTLLWQVRHNFDTAELGFASSLDGNTAVISAVRSLRLNAGGQSRQALPGASAASFDEVGNLALLQSEGLPSTVAWYSPSGVPLRSDALGPTQTSAYGAIAAYDSSGKLNAQYLFVDGLLTFDNVRQYSANGVFSSSYRATGELQSFSTVPSDFWYGLRTDGSNLKQLLVRDLPNETSALVSIPCTVCEFNGAVGIENGVILFEQGASGQNETLWMFQGAQRLPPISIQNVSGLVATPLQPAGDIARFTADSAAGQIRTVFGISPNGKVTSRFTAPINARLEPSGGLVGQGEFGAYFKIDAMGNPDLAWQPCGARQLFFNAHGHWGLLRSSGKSSLCYATQGEVFSALIQYDESSFMSSFGTQRNDILLGNQIFSLANGQIARRELAGVPVALNDTHYAVFARNAETNTLRSYPMPQAELLDRVIFTDGFDD